VTAQVNATSSPQTSSGATGGNVQTVSLLTAVLIATVSLRGDGVPGLGSTADPGGGTGNTNGPGTAANRVAPLNPGVGGDPEVIPEDWDELAATRAASLGLSDSGLRGVIGSLLKALRRRGQDSMRRHDTPVRPGPVPTAPVPADAGVLWLDPVPDESATVLAAEGEVSAAEAAEALVDAWLADSSHESISALLGLATLTVGLSWSGWVEESEDTHPRRQRRAVLHSRHRATRLA